MDALAQPDRDTGRRVGGTVARPYLTRAGGAPSIQG